MNIAPADKSELARYEIPLSEAQAKQWINSLSSTDIGETTQRVFYGLIDFNRRVVPPLTRIRIAEHLRPKFEGLQTNLQRHLKSQSFPLPPRSQKISDLNHSLLLEYAGLYQLAALDMMNQEAERKKALQVAIYRVIDYLGKYLVSAYAVYARTRETIWHDINNMFLIATERGLDKLKISGESTRSIEERYLQLNLLSLCKPYSLRQEEVLRLERFINENTKLVTLTKEPVQDESVGHFVYAAIMNHDESAVIIPYGDLPRSPTVRVFNLRGLVMKLDTLINDKNHEHSTSSILGKIINRNLAKRLIFHLTTVRNREHNRFDCDEKILVVMGMQAVHQVVDNARRLGEGDTQREEDLLFNSMLYGDQLPDPDAEDASTMMSRMEKECGVRIWQVKNNSVCGYGLHWDSPTSSPAKVGELVGLRDLREQDNPWMTGVVKWMECRPKQGLFCGVELLSVETRTCEVTEVISRQVNHTLPLQALMLPAIEGLREEPVMILPAYTFVSGDELRVSYDGREERLSLSTLDECLGTFAHFHFKVCDPKDENKNEDGFAGLWDTL